MEETTLSTLPHGDIALTRLDQTIAQVRELQADQDALLLEHLQSARSYLLGAMPVEYEFNLRAAKGSVSNLKDPSARKSIGDDIEDLLDEAASHAPKKDAVQPSPPESRKPQINNTRSALHRFLHGSETSLGVFYPTHYVFAAFPSLEDAENAARALRSGGFTQLVVASSQETADFFAELRAETGLWGAVMESLSRFFGTEEVFADIDTKEAQKGAGFLVVYCPQEDQAERIRDIVAPCRPLAMQLYLPSGVRSLWAGKFPGPQGHHPEQE